MKKTTAMTKKYTLTQITTLSAALVMAIGLSACSTTSKSTNHETRNIASAGFGGTIEDVIAVVKGTPKSEAAMIKSYDNYRLNPANAKLGLTEVSSVDEIPTRFESANAKSDFVGFLYSDMKASGAMTANMERAFKGTSNSVDAANSNYQGSNLTFQKPGFTNEQVQLKLKEVEAIAPGTTKLATSANRSIASLEAQGKLPKGTANEKLEADLELAKIAGKPVMGSCESIINSKEAIHNEIRIEQSVLKEKPANQQELAEAMVRKTEDQLYISRDRACANLRNLSAAPCNEVNAEIVALACPQ